MLGGSRGVVRVVRAMYGWDEIPGPARCEVQQPARAGTFLMDHSAEAVLGRHRVGIIVNWQELCGLPDYFFRSFFSNGRH